MHGTLRRDRQHAEPRATVLKRVPAPPRRLSRDGKRFWRTQGARLVASGVLTSSDLYSFEVLANAYGRLCEVERALARDGLTSTGSMGQPTRHPLIDVLNTSATLYRQLAARFGLTPADRGSLDVPYDDKADPLDELLARKRARSKVLEFK